MNILVISPQMYPCITGGVEIFNYYLVSELASRENSIRVITNCDEYWGNSKIIIEKLNNKILCKFTIFVLFEIFIKIIYLRKKIDVIHVPYTSNSPLVYPVLLCSKLFKIPYLAVIHGGGLRPWRPKVVQKSFFLNAENIVAVSETIKKEYEKRTNRKIHIIYPLIPFKESKFSKKELRTRYSFSENNLILLSLGSIKKIKGSDLLLQTFINLGEEYIMNNNLILIYVGDGDLKTTLEKKTVKSKFQKYVRFLGKMPHEKVPEMYKLADVYIIPSLFEGTSISLLEAMYNGLPIIGANTNGINNIIIHEMNGLLFNKGDQHSLQNMIEIIVEDKELRLKLANAAKTDYFDKYSYQEIVDQHLKIAHDAMENRNV